MRRIMSFVSQASAGLRFRLLLLVLLVCAPLVALTLNRAWQDRRRAVTNWQLRSQRMAELAMGEEQKLIVETRQLLVAMAESAPVRTASRRGCKKLVDELFAISPRYANLGVIGTNGDVLAAALGSVSSANLVDQEFFQRAATQRAFSIDHFPGRQLWLPGH